MLNHHHHQLHIKPILETAPVNAGSVKAELDTNSGQKSLLDVGEKKRSAQHDTMDEDVLIQLKARTGGKSAKKAAEDAQQIAAGEKLWVGRAAEEADMAAPKEVKGQAAQEKATAPVATKMTPEESEKAAGKEVSEQASQEKGPAMVASKMASEEAEKEKVPEPLAQDAVTAMVATQRPADEAEKAPAKEMLHQAAQEKTTAVAATEKAGMFERDRDSIIDGHAVAWMLVVVAFLLVAVLYYHNATFAVLVDAPAGGCDEDLFKEAERMDANFFVSCSPPHVSGICEPGKSDVLLPSGIWRGYSQEVGNDFEVVEFVLNFASASDDQPVPVTGNGTDDVGKYSLTGVYEQRRLAFQKKYILDTPSSDGHTQSNSSLGHVVEYRAEWAGDDLRKGIRGIWFFEEGVGSSFFHNGMFHVWPAMDGWQQIGHKAAMASEVPVKRAEDGEISASLDHESCRWHVTGFEVDPKQKCAKCYENPINICLLPCCHTAICRACESGLRTRLCPICYAPVNMLLTENGSILKPR